MNSRVWLVLTEEIKCGTSLRHAEKIALGSLGHLGCVLELLRLIHVNGRYEYMMNK